MQRTSWGPSYVKHYRGQLSEIVTAYISFGLFMIFFSKVDIIDINVRDNFVVLFLSIFLR